jgi:hypothetical protein
MKPSKQAVVSAAIGVILALVIWNMVTETTVVNGVSKTKLKSGKKATAPVV